MLNSLLIVIAFISIIPIPEKFLPDWNKNNLRYFVPMLPICGTIFGASWISLWYILKFVNLSGNMRGFLMTLFTLALTGGLHMDGLMDTCDAIFSHKDRAARLQILSDTHAGSFAVMGCVVIFLAKTFLFAEIFSLSNGENIFFIPIYSRLGMAALLNNMPFAKSGGLAVTLGSSRKKRDNFLLALIFFASIIFCNKILACEFIIILATWAKTCKKIFGGITGDLLGAFVEICEAFLLMGVVISNCI